MPCSNSKVMKQMLVRIVKSGFMVESVVLSCFIILDEFDVVLSYIIKCSDACNFCIETKKITSAAM